MTTPFDITQETYTRFTFERDDRACWVNQLKPVNSWAREVVDRVSRTPPGVVQLKSLS